MLAATSSPKIRAQHLERQAVVYVRQSTLIQVRDHTSSATRQYDLVARARDLGWGPADIRLIDQDQGQSGASAMFRDGFQQVVAEVGLGRSGPSSVWKPRAWLAPAAIGISCWRSAP